MRGGHRIMGTAQEPKMNYIIKEGRQALSLDDQMKGLPFMCNSIDAFVALLKREGGSSEWADIFD